jgi:hypothetical protein
MEYNIDTEVQMTAEEIAAAIAIQRNNALNATHPASWVWNEEKVSWVAPRDPPTDGFPYLWDEDSNSWTPFPDYPR